MRVVRLALTMLAVAVASGVLLGTARCQAPATACTAASTKAAVKAFVTAFNEGDFAANRIAFVSLTGLPANGSPVGRVRVITQIARSLIGLSGIQQVRLRNDGKPWGLWLMSGGSADTAYGYRVLLGFTGVGGAGGSFAALP